MIMFNLRLRAAVERVLAAGATLNSEPLVVYDGRKPRKPPGVRVLFFELGFGWTPEDIKGAVQGVRHVEPHFYVDEHGTKTRIRMTSCTLWLERCSLAGSRSATARQSRSTHVSPRARDTASAARRARRARRASARSRPRVHDGHERHGGDHGIGPTSPVLTAAEPTSASPPSVAPSKPQSPYAIVHLPGQEKQTEDEWKTRGARRPRRLLLGAAPHLSKWKIKLFY